MSESLNFPTVMPSLLLDFANRKSLDPRITFTRASTATFTGPDGLIQTAAVGVPRFDFNPTTRESLGLLVEEQRTNLLTYSEQFDNAAWTKLASSISANNNVSPNGALSADNIIEDATTGIHIALQNPITVTSSTAYTFSAYCKPAGRTWVQLIDNGGSGANAYFNLSLGVTGTISGGTTAAITSVGNGWYRCTISFNTSVSQTSVNAQIRIATADLTNSYTGDGTSGLFIWGAQLEAGAFPTSYIPTVASSVTRSADAASMTGVNFSEWYRADEGTFVCWSDNASTGYRTAFIADDGTSNNKMFVQTNITANGQQWASRAAATWVVTLSNQGWTNNGKTAACYKFNDYYYSTNGAASTGNTSAAVPTVNRLVLGAEAAANYLNGHIKKIAYYPWRLTNAQLQALTS